MPVGLCIWSVSNVKHWGHSPFAILPKMNVAVRISTTRGMARKMSLMKPVKPWTPEETRNLRTKQNHPPTSSIAFHEATEWHYESQIYPCYTVREYIQFYFPTAKRSGTRTNTTSWDSSHKHSHTCTCWVLKKLHLWALQKTGLELRGVTIKEVRGHFWNTCFIQRESFFLLGITSGKSDLNRKREAFAFSETFWACFAVAVRWNL